jgi:hypothetical protein
MKRISKQQQQQQQPSLDFDGLKDFDRVEAEVVSPLWQEVPQALFLSWSERRQYSYCMLRDLNSSIDEPENEAWYLERAESYRQLAGVKPYGT